MEILISPKVSPKVLPNSNMAVIRQLVIRQLVKRRQDIIEKTSAAEFVFARDSTVECSSIIDPIIFHDASSFFDQYVRPLLTSQNWRIHARSKMRASLQAEIYIAILYLEGPNVLLIK